MTDDAENRLPKAGIGPQRAYFARVLTDLALDQTIELARRAAGGSLDGLIQRDAETVVIHAPDGDQVLIALKSRPDVWLVRLHKEVFRP